jgi:hypothetical protein
VCEQDDAYRLALNLVDASAGYIIGTLWPSASGPACDVVGFTDSDAVASDVPLQGLTLSATLRQGSCISLAGSLDRASGRLSLTDMTSTGTTAGNTYVQTHLGDRTFRHGATSAGRRTV